MSAGSAWRKTSSKPKRVHHRVDVVRLIRRFVPTLPPLRRRVEGQLVPLHRSQSQNAPRRAASTATIAVSASDHDHRHRTVRIHPWIRTESPPGLSRHEIYAGISPLTHVPISVHLMVRLWCSDAPLHWTARGSAGVRSRDRVGYEQTGTLARARRCFI